VLRKVFCLKTDGASRDVITLRIEDSEVYEATIVETRSACRILVAKPIGKRQFERQRRRCKISS
jgi:hypothetical protein